MEDWIIANVEPFLNLFQMALINLFNLFIWAFSGLFDLALSWLPDLTIPVIAEIDNEWKLLQLWNWFFPMDAYLAWAVIWVSSETIYIASAPFCAGLNLSRIRYG